MHISTRHKLSVLTSSLLIAFSAPAFAQQETDTMTVLGKNYRNTATKTALTPEETSQGISVIEREQLAQRRVKSLNQALRYTPGVVTETKGSSVTMYDTFYIRGFQVSQSYYDGLALQYLTGWNLQPQIDPVALEQVEVFKGPTSVLYGAMPPGGMVNMIAKTPQQERHTELDLSVGSDNLTEASIDTTGQLGNSKLAYRLIALARKKDSQADTAEEERYILAPSLDWQVSDKTLLNVNLYYQKDPAMGINSALPASGMITPNANGSVSPSTYAGDKNWSRFEREFLLTGIRLNHEFNPNWTWLTNARYMDAELSQRNTYHSAAGFDASTGTLNRYIYSTDEQSHGVTVDNQLSGQVQTADWQHHLLLGIDYQQLRGDSDYRTYSTSDASFSQFNIFSPDNDLLNPATLTQTGRYQYAIELEQLGVYFQDQIRTGNWVTIFGGRFDDYSASSEISGSVTEANDSEFSYRIGALYEFASGFSPFLSYATSFEPKAGVDSKFGQPYEPETAVQVEAGVKYQAPDYSKSFTLSAFEITKSNMVVTNPASANYQDDIQVGEVRVRGAEFEGRWYINDNWDVTGSYTYTDMEVTKDSANGLQGTTPIYVPEQTASLWSNYRIYSGPLAGSRISGGARYVGSMQMNATNTQGKVPSYTITDLSLGYDLGHLSRSLDGATTSLLVNNLFDEESYTCYDNANCWYGADRSVELNVNYAF